MMNTIRNVTIVVPVLITSCQVLEKPRSGPVQAQTTRTATAATKTQGWPNTFAVREVNLVKKPTLLPLLFSVLMATPCGVTPHAYGPLTRCRVLPPCGVAWSGTLRG